MKTLIEKIAAYERCVQGLLDKIQEYNKICCENIPEEFLPQFGYRRIYGSLELHQDGNIIPYNVENCGSFFYWGGDFNRGHYRATRKQVVEFAKSLPRMIEAAEKFIDEKLAEIENL